LFSGPLAKFFRNSGDFLPVILFVAHRLEPLTQLQMQDKYTRFLYTYRNMRLFLNYSKVLLAKSSVPAVQRHPPSLLSTRSSCCGSSRTE
jgi:hypothetical protein